MDSELFAAAISGNNNVLKMKDGVKKVADQRTPTENTVLHLASESGRAECVKQILKSHPCLLCKANSKGETALHLAVGGGHLNVVRLLLDEARLLLDEAQTSQEISEKNDHMKLIRMVNEDSDSALHEAVRHNHVEIVRILAENDPKDVHSPNIYHMSPLYLAAFNGNVKCFEIILKTCSKPTEDGPDGRTLLHAAVMSGSIECVKYILSERLNLTKATDIHGWTALHYAAYFDFSETIEDITDLDKSIAYITDKTAKRTALHIAAQHGNLSVLKQLITFCPYSCDMVDLKGRNILHLALEYDHKTVVEYIIQNCPMIQSILNQKDIDKDTPLHYAAKYGCFVRLLIKHKLVHRDALNHFHLTPLDVIRWCNLPKVGDQEKVELLLVQLGAVQNLNIKDAHEMYHLLPRRVTEKTSQKWQRFEITKKLSTSYMVIAAAITMLSLTIAARSFN